ncbi:MAG: hypothetical protein ACRCWQ_06790 [Bacilli bacterium]
MTTNLLEKNDQLTEILRTTETQIQHLTTEINAIHQQTTDELFQSIRLQQEQRQHTQQIHRLSHQQRINTEQIVELKEEMTSLHTQFQQIIRLLNTVSNKR